MERWADVAVHAQGDRNRRVAEAFLYDSRVDAALEGDSGPGVAQAMQREVPKAVATNSAEELFAHGFGGGANCRRACGTRDLGR